MRENFKIKNLFIFRRHVKFLVPNVKRIPKTRQALSFRTLREESFERLNYTASYILSALQCIRRKHQLRAAQRINSRSLRIENCVSQEFFMNTFMEKAFLKYSLRVHQKFLLIIW